MPLLVVRGIKPEQMMVISESLIEDLAVICECELDNFTIECLHTTAVFSGKIVESFPFIEVSWFERGQETRDRFARTVANHVQSLGIKEIEIAFNTYREDSYYVNGSL
ncbi:DUF1904 family protein [Ammoniphilus sp. CFH 90114]|uniref:DUF1904 family protein n=1 Tax=Ammoniphilus sp. CFH 90114 TaxID=2493665 RepID=UPI00100EF33D|nr:DUF1904 family protein [Ammoniphilus sp. CFH 90114]RXT07244.1 DUF1904 family protein [Ammoniphilus sp. CFH 90114]